MTDERKAAIAIIAGSLGGMLTMAIHPQGAAGLTPDQANHLATMSAIAHSIAMVSFLLLFLGACGLTCRLTSIDSTAIDKSRLPFAALVTFGFSCFAILIATTVSGFIVPSILRHMVYDAPATQPEYRLIISAIFQFNQAFSKIYSVGASAAIALWSLAAIRYGGLSRGLATYGCIVSPLIVLGILVGHLRLDIHGMAVIVLAHATWWIIAAIQLTSKQTSSLAA